MFKQALAAAELGAQIPLALLPNLRDIGGYPVPGGWVRTGCCTAPWPSTS